MSRLIAFLLTLLFVTPALADAPACTGHDLTAELKASDPAKYAEVMRAADATPNGNAIFWKIERNGTAPSWLLGTAHVTDPRVTTLTPEAGMALDNASVVVLELAELAKPGLAEIKALGSASLMVLPLGKSLWDLIPGDEQDLIRKNVNLPPGGVESIYGLQPWVVATALSIPPCETLRKQHGLKALDQMIGERAAARGIAVAGLETVDEQMRALGSMPQDLQLKYLLAVAKQGPQIADFFETLIRLYQERRIAAYEPFVDATQAMGGEEKAIMAYVDEDLVRQRNHRMAERALPFLARGNAFIAIGALHLPGKEGVVALLRQAGYKLTPVN